MHSVTPGQVSAAWGAAAHAALSTLARKVTTALVARAAAGSSAGDGDGGVGSGSGTSAAAGAGAGVDAVTNDAPSSDDDAAGGGVGAGAVAGMGLRARGDERKGVRYAFKRPLSACASSGAAADEGSGAPAKRASPGDETVVGTGAGNNASPIAAAAVAADASDREVAVADADSTTRQSSIPGLRSTRLATLRRGELGSLLSDVKGGVSAGADTSQPSMAKGAGLLLPNPQTFRESGAGDG